MNRRLAAVAVCASLLTAGCGTEPAAQPSVVITGSPTATPSTTPPSGTEAPGSRVLVIHGSPCDLLTADQQRQLAVDQPPRIDVSIAADMPPVACRFASTAQHTSFGISPLTGVTFDDYVSTRIAQTPQQLTVRGYHAVSLYGWFSDNVTDSCVVLVETGDGSAVHVVYDADGPSRSLGRALCDRAGTVADLVIQNLLAE